MSWQLSLPAGADQGVVADDVWHEALLQHLVEDLQGTLWILALPTGADQGVVGDMLPFSQTLVKARMVVVVSLCW